MNSPGRLRDSRSMSILTTLLTGAVALYLLTALAIWLGQSRLLFYPTTGPYPRTPDAVDLPWRDIALTTRDGLRLTGWFIEGPTADAPVVLFLHGNAGDMSGRLDTLSWLHELGAATFIIDYRGYGTSEGRPTEAGLYLDGAAAWDWLTGEAGYRPGEIVLFGRSLGGAVAAQLAADRGCAGLVLESAFVSLPELAGDLYPWLPAAYLTRYSFDTASALAHTDCPVLLAHSPADEIVPFDHAERLAQVRPESTRLLRLSGTHNEPSFSTNPSYRSAVAAFIERATTSQGGNHE